ncbi:MAG: hypothetical protein ACXQTY_02555 [Candidatus Methanogasteraceae archaeon]
MASYNTGCRLRQNGFGNHDWITKLRAAPYTKSHSYNLDQIKKGENKMQAATQAIETTGTIDIQQ